MPVRIVRQPPTQITEMIEKKQSMLSHDLPLGYGAIETATEAMSAAAPLPEPHVLRLHIVWDCPARELPLERALDVMRETGAAMVVRVEEVE